MLYCAVISDENKHHSASQNTQKRAKFEVLLERGRRKHTKLDRKLEEVTETPVIFDLVFDRKMLKERERTVTVCVPLQGLDHLKSTFLH